MSTCLNFPFLHALTQTAPWPLNNSAHVSLLWSSLLTPLPPSFFIPLPCFTLPRGTTCSGHCLCALHLPHHAVAPWAQGLCFVHCCVLTSWNSAGLTQCRLSGNIERVAECPLGRGYSRGIGEMKAFSHMRTWSLHREFSSGSGEETGVLGLPSPLPADRRKQAEGELMKQEASAPMKTQKLHSGRTRCVGWLPDGWMTGQEGGDRKEGSWAWGGVSKNLCSTSRCGLTVTTWEPGQKSGS